MNPLLEKCREWLAKLAFWRKRIADDDTPTQPADEPTEAINKAPNAPESAIADVEPSAENEAEPSPATVLATPDTEESPAPTLSFAARLKRIFNFRRKPLEAEIIVSADDTPQVSEQTDANAEASATAGETDTPPPSAMQRISAQLRNKWVWIPGLSLALVGIVSWIVIVMLHSANEKAHLQAELAAAKKMLAEKQATIPPAPAPPHVAAPSKHESVPEPAHGEKKEPKIDPAFNIVGQIPATQSENSPGVNTSDCLIKDKNSVSENLKHCINSFNQAVSGTPPRKKP